MKLCHIQRKRAGRERYKKTEKYQGFFNTLQSIITAQTPWKIITESSVYVWHSLSTKTAHYKPRRCIKMAQASMILYPPPTGTADIICQKHLPNSNKRMQIRARPLLDVKKKYPNATHWGCSMLSDLWAVFISTQRDSSPVLKPVERAVATLKL